MSDIRRLFCTGLVQGRGVQRKLLIHEFMFRLLLIRFMIHMTPYYALPLHPSIRLIYRTMSDSSSAAWPDPCAARRDLYHGQ